LGKQKTESGEWRSEGRWQKSEVGFDFSFQLSRFQLFPTSVVGSVFSFQLSVFSFFPSLTTNPRQMREMPPGSQRRPVHRLALEQRGQVPAENLLRLAHQVRKPALRKANSTENSEEPALHS
jgi:hypothetical protein